MAEHPQRQLHRIRRAFLEHVSSLRRAIQHKDHIQMDIDLSALEALAPRLDAVAQEIAALQSGGGITPAQEQAAITAAVAAQQTSDQTAQATAVAAAYAQGASDQLAADQTAVAGVASTLGDDVGALEAALGAVSGGSGATGATAGATGPTGASGASGSTGGASGPTGASGASAGATTAAATVGGTSASSSGTVTNSGALSPGAATGGVTITSALVISPATLPDATVGEPYSEQLSSTSVSGHPEFSSGNLPPGLGLTPAGLLSGTPATEGDASFDVTVTDQAGNTGKITYALNVDAASD